MMYVCSPFDLCSPPVSFGKLILMFFVEQAVEHHFIFPECTECIKG